MFDEYEKYALFYGIKKDVMIYEKEEKASGNEKGE